MKCMHCGHDISDTAKFCAFCGTAQKIEPSAQLAENGENKRPESLTNQPMGSVEIKKPKEMASAATPWTTAPVAPPVGDTSGKKGRRGRKRFLLPGIILLAAFLGTGIYLAGQMGYGPMGTSDSYEEQCLSVDTEALCKEPDLYKGEDIHVYGEVFAIMEEKEQRYLAIDTIYDNRYDMYYGGTLVIADDGVDMGDVQEGDRVDIYGRVTGGTKVAKTPIITVEAPLIKAKIMKSGH